MLDNAVCSRQLRPLYLQTIQSPQFLLVVPTLISDKMIAWAMVRRVHFSEVSLSRTLQIDAALRKTFLLTCGTCIRTLSWAADLDDEEANPEGTDFRQKKRALHAPEMLTDIAAFCPQLHTFIITFVKPCRRLLDGTISIILNACPKLRAVRVEYTAQQVSGPSGTETFGVNQAFLNALYEAPGLVEILLDQCDLNTWPADVGQAAVSAAQNTTVKSLMLRRMCPDWRGVNQECIIRHFPNLIHINAQLQTDEWHAVAELLPHMRCVAFNDLNFKTISLRKILPLWRNLEEVRMGSTYPGVQFLCSLVDLAPTIQRLYIKGINTTALLSEVRSPRLSAPAPKLVFPPGYSGSRLRELHVAVKYMQAAEDLQAVLDKCPYLHVLSLFDFVDIVPISTLDALASDICSVKVLFINQGCQARNTVTDAHLQGVRGLHEFYLYKINTQRSLITTEGVHALVQRCPELRVLYLKDAVHVSKETRDVLPILEACPHLRVLAFPSTPPLVDASTAHAASRAGRSTRGVSKAKAAVAGPPPPDPTELLQIIKEKYSNLWHVVLK